jgi:hypothetical protein
MSTKHIYCTSENRGNKSGSGTSFPIFKFRLTQFIHGLLLPPVSSLNGLPANILCSHAIIRASIIIISSGWRTTFHHLAIAIVILDRSAAHRSTALVEQRCRSCAIILPAACIRYTATIWGSMPQESRQLQSYLKFADFGSMNESGFVVKSHVMEPEALISHQAGTAHVFHSDCYQQACANNSFSPRSAPSRHEALEARG